MVEFEKVLATAVEQKKILIVEGKVDFETADADVIDCAKWKVLDSKGMIVKCEKEDGVVRLTMKNGEVIELGVTCGR